MIPALHPGSADVPPPSGAQAIPPHVARQAVQWLLELQAADVAPQVRAEWERWLAADPAHRHAWQRIEEVNSKLHQAANPLAAAVARAKLTAEASAGRRRAVKAVALLVFGGGAAWMAERRTPWRDMLADLRTDVGGRKQATLPDGTEIVLNTATAVNVRFSATERRLQLVAGELLIATASDSSSTARAFVVETRHGEALALGTRFTVRQRESASRVAVFEGAVELRPREPLSRPRLLSAGQQAEFTGMGTTPPVPVEQAASTAWTRGNIVALSMRLGDFIEELNRYSTTPLSCDPAVADLRISGSYPTGDIDSVLSTLAKVLSLEIHTATRFWGRQVVRISLAPAQKPG